MVPDCGDIEADLGVTSPAAALSLPLESRFPPTFMVSQGFRCSMYSFIVDSRRKANLPFDFRTRVTPSGVVLTNTEGSADFMYDHIFSYTAILDRCVEERRKRTLEAPKTCIREMDFAGFLFLMIT
ncbi:hypothetical protein GOODEAATRI_014281 [Goodea atripinnis]|uniref:Uncharacterized protein n=1 Tax=Goodea atripinnis TaxID=208336 RepID=A0ABV0PP00_9TELE